MKKSLVILLMGILMVSSVVFAENKEKKDPNEYVFGWQQLIRPERDLVYYPDKVIKILGIDPGDRIGEIDPGPGYWTFRFAEAVGSEGKVFAIQAFSIDAKDMDEYFASKIADPGSNPYGNIVFSKSEPDDINMPEDSLDMVFLCLNGYLIFDLEKKTSDPDIKVNFDVKRTRHSNILKSIYRALKPGGRLAVIDVYNSPVIKMLGGPDVDYLCEFIPEDGNIDIVRKNYEDIGFIFEKEINIYSSQKHRDNILSFCKTDMFTEISSGEKPVYCSERFFFVFRKQES